MKKGNIKIGTVLNTTLGAGTVKRAGNSYTDTNTGKHWVMLTVELADGTDGFVPVLEDELDLES